MSPEEEIFNLTLESAKSGFEKSKNQKLIKSNWGLSICGTPIQIGKPLLMGINWGGGSSSDPFPYTIQETMPSFDEFIKLYNEGEYGFLKKIEPFAKKYCNIESSSGEFNYTNLCFFRTPNVKELTNEDYNVCGEIFKTMIKNIKPPQIISLGTGNIKYLKEFFKNEFRCEENNDVPKSETSLKIYSGCLFGFKFYSLPHPVGTRNLSNEIYDKLWQALFKNQN